MRFVKRLFAIIFFLVSLCGLILGIVAFTEDLSSSFNIGMAISCSIVFLVCLMFALMLWKSSKTSSAETVISGETTQSETQLPTQNTPDPFAGRKIESASIITGHAKTSVGSAVVRGAVGGALLGPVGLLAAAGAKKNDFVTVLIRYRNGRTKTQKMRTNSSEFKRIARYIK